MKNIIINNKTLSLNEIQTLLETDHPLVERFEFVPKMTGVDTISFRIDIIGRVGAKFWQIRDSNGDWLPEPIERTITENDDIGCGNRNITTHSGMCVATNETFFPNQEFNDLGIGSAMYEAQERFYRSVGVELNNLLAVDVGTYVWARQGFRFEDASLVRKHVDKMESFLSAYDIKVGNKSSFSESWDIANYTVNNVLIDRYPPGKAYILYYRDSWYGYKYLEDDESTSIATKSREETKSRQWDKIITD